MKKVLITLAIAISSLVAFAGEENVSKDVLNSFNKEFNGAKEVRWTTGSDFYKAVFVLNDQYITAFYNKDGEFLGMTRNISSLNLPLKLQSKIRSDYAEYWISDLFELSDNDGTHYYITVENADSKLLLKSSDNTDWNIFKKMTKI
jgi:hypothetical protein